MAKYNSKGNIIFKWTVSSTLTTIGQAVSVDIDSAAQAIDVTDLDDSAREFVMSIVDGGEVTVEFLLDPAAAEYVALRADWKAQTQRAAQLTVVSATRSFTAGVLSCRESGGEGQPLRATVVFKVSGAITDA